MKTRSLLAWLLVLLPVFWATQARAYVHTLSCREGADPEVDPMACLEGQTPVPIYWDRDCAIYHVHESGCADLDACLDLRVPLTEVRELGFHGCHKRQENLFRAVRAAFDAWNEPDCSYLELIDGGLTNEDRIGYYSCDPRLNANIVVFRHDGWEHQRAALALTSVTFNTASGEIVDADIEFNDQWFTFSSTDTPALVRNDIRNTLTHEVGHFLGLDHTDDTEATMYLRAPMGELDKRSLEQDDIEGLCSIYPVAEARGSCDTSSTGYFVQPEQAPGAACPRDSSCCDCSMSPGQKQPVLAVIFLVLGAFTFGCRRARRGDPGKNRVDSARGSP